MQATVERVRVLRSAIKALEDAGFIYITALVKKVADDMTAELPMTPEFYGAMKDKLDPGKMSITFRAPLTDRQVQDICGALMRTFPVQGIKP